MTTNKKVNATDKTNNDEITVEAPELENIFNFDKEAHCYKGQYFDESNKLQYERWQPIDQTRWNNFKARCIDVKSGRWFTNGEGSGRCLGKEGPRRFITALIRLKANDGNEYLLSNSTIRAFNQSGDPVITTATWPEKYIKTLFRFETVPNHETGYSERRNMGPSGSEIVYTLPFSTANAQKLFDLRENGKDIQFIVKSEDKGRVYEVKPQLNVTETFKLFSENSFEYLYYANYISTEQKLLNAKLAEGEGLIPKESEDDRKAAILAQEALSDKQKMASYQ